MRKMPLGIRTDMLNRYIRDWEAQLRLARQFVISSFVCGKVEIAVRDQRGECREAVDSQAGESDRPSRNFDLDWKIEQSA